MFELALTLHEGGKNLLKNAKKKYFGFNGNKITRSEEANKKYA